MTTQHRKFTLFGFEWTGPTGRQVRQKRRKGAGNKNSSLEEKEFGVHSSIHTVNACQQLVKTDRFQWFQSTCHSSVRRLTFSYRERPHKGCEQRETL